MYKINAQGEATNQQMGKLYQHMTGWLISSKKALEEKDYQNYQRLIERITHTQQFVVSLFEPLPYANESQKKSCRLIQDSANQTLVLLLQYISDPQTHYEKLKKNLVSTQTIWMNLEPQHSSS